jgi:molybdate transport system substrate-binding protein
MRGSIALLLVVFQAGFVDAAEISVLTAAGMRPVMEELGPKFESATGHSLSMQFAPADVVTKRVRNGEAAHAVITTWQIAALAKEGKVVPESIAVVGRAGLGLAVKKGAAKPDISSPDALKRALLAARSITYLDPTQEGDSGYHFAKVLERFGIAEEVRRKAVIPKTTAAVGSLVATGEAEIAILAIQHIAFISNVGLELVGPLPSEVQETMVFSAAILSAAVDRDAANALIAFLCSSEARAVMRAKGMEAQ